MNPRNPRGVSAKIAITSAALLLAPFVQASEGETSDHAPLPTPAGSFTLKVEPGVTFPVTHPQSQMFKTGGSEPIKALWGLNPYLDLGPSATFVTLPSETSLVEAGTAWTFGDSLARIAAVSLDSNTIVKPAP
jgi:hypothetical protein